MSSQREFSNTQEAMRNLPLMEDDDLDADELFGDDFFDEKELGQSADDIIGDEDLLDETFFDDIPAAGKSTKKEEKGQSSHSHADDLFGSDDDEAQSSGHAKGELFGDDDGAQGNDADLFGSEDEGLNEGGLFGSEDEGDAIEEDLFGDGGSVAGEEMYDDEPDRKKRTVTMSVSSRRPIHRDVTRSVFKLPNVITMDNKPFDRDTFDPDSKIAFREVTDFESHRYIQLENAENCIRWRFERDANGQIVNGEDGRPRMQSNARYVEWSDGTASIVIGNETFRVRGREDPVHLFDHRNGLKVFQGVVNQQITATPWNLSSKTHQSLKNSQINKVKSNRKMMLQIHGPEEEARRKDKSGETSYARAAAKRMALMNERSEKRARVLHNTVQNAMDIQDEGQGVSLKNLKAAFKNQ